MTSSLYQNSLEEDMVKVALLGCGNLGYDIARALVTTIGKNQLYIAEKNQSLLKKHRQEFVYVTRNPQEAINHSDMACILTKPDDVDDLFETISLPHKYLLINF